MPTGAAICSLTMSIAVLFGGSSERFQNEAVATVNGSSIKTAIRGGQAVFGTFVTDITTAAIAEMLVAAGFDFFFIDMEHGSVDFETVSSITSAARALGIAPIVRIPWNDRVWILRALELGAAGILVPMVESRDDAEQILRCAKYAPEGARGVALRRLHSHYRRVDPIDYTRQANQETIVLVQIESVRAVGNVDDILSVPGIDVAYVGPSDLSQSLGLLGKMDDPALIGSIVKVIASARRHGISPGIHANDASSVRRWVKEGVRFISLGSDVGFLIDGAASSLSSSKSRASDFLEHEAAGDNNE